MMHYGGKTSIFSSQYIDGLVQERRYSSALAMELRHSCTEPSIYHMTYSVPSYYLNQ